jgi:hypothetical protein
MQDDAKRSGNLLFPEIVPADLAALGRDRIKAMMETQKEFLGTLEEMNRSWLSRTDTLTKLIAELSENLSKARSVPETTDAYQHFGKRRMEVFLEDSRRFFDNSQKFMEATVRLLDQSSPNGESRVEEEKPSAATEDGAAEMRQRMSRSARGGR